MRISLLLLTFMPALAHAQLPTSLEAMGTSYSRYSRELPPEKLRPETDGFIADITVDASERCNQEITQFYPGQDCTHIPDHFFSIPDEHGKLWKIRFYFGFSRTIYLPTDLHIRSPKVNATIRDVRLIERTSAKHYNPAIWNWNSFLKWIDEPSNTMTLTFEKNKNEFNITLYHPKYLKSIFYREVALESGTFEFKHNSDEEMIPLDRIPEGYSLMYLGNTHLNVDLTLGYGRQFNLYKLGRGRLMYTPHIDAGVSIGQSRNVDMSWDGISANHVDDFKVQGLSLSVGQRLDYRYRRFSIFTDQRVIWWKRKHDWSEGGTVNYSLIAIPITFGVSFDLISNRRSID